MATPALQPVHRGLALAGAVALLVCVGSVGSDAAVPWNVRLSTNNDILSNDVEDDFYTFGARLDLSIATWTLRWEENAFTDREMGLRFDETYLTLGTFVPAERLGGWYLWVEGGAAWIGEGFLGQDAQNDVHELLDNSPVDLVYVEFDDRFVHGQLEIGRQWRLGPTWSTGPIVSGSWTPDFRTNALAGWRTIWRPSDRFGVDLIVGGRYADSELALLERRLERQAPAALVEIDLPWHLVLEWSLNRYGTERQHLALGVSFGPGRSLRRTGRWGEKSNAAP